METVSNLQPISYEEVDLTLPFESYNLKHELTDVGIDKFCSDWNLSFSDRNLVSNQQLFSLLFPEKD